ncbi:MAG TPA: nucleotidyltransferase domain-containing protein [bacterium]|nr:nucleotidyltransferase domain-containing protein [bacterium]
MGAILDDLKSRFPNYPNLKAVEDFVIGVVKDLDPLLIIMFGALPRGDYTYNSDVDTLLITDEPTTWNEIYAYGGGVVQPISKTKDDFIQQLKRGNPFFIQIMEEGIILHSRVGVLDEFKTIASETISKMRMIRVERGWEIDDEDEEEEEV